MIDIKTGRFTINSEEGWEMTPFLTIKELTSSKLWQANQSELCEERSNKRTFFFKQLEINGYPLSMEIHVGRNDYIDGITLRTELSANIHEWISGPEWESTALKQKQTLDEFLIRETSIPPQLISKDKDLSIDTNWGCITSVMDLSANPDICVTIRYRNMSESDKEKYLTMGRKYLHGEK